MAEGGGAATGELAKPPAALDLARDNSGQPATARARWGDALFQGASAAVVAVFCYSTARLVPRLPEAYWAPIAALVVLYPDREAAKKAALQRFVGTLLGSAIGWGGAVWWHHRALILGLAILLAVALCHVLRLEAASRLCAVSVTVITVIPHAEPAFWAALHRFAEVSYGVACAMAYTVLVDPILRRYRNASRSETLILVPDPPPPGN